MGGLRCQAGANRPPGQGAVGGAKRLPGLSQLANCLPAPARRDSRGLAVVQASDERAFPALLAATIFIVLSSVAFDGVWEMSSGQRKGRALYAQDERSLLRPGCSGRVICRRDSMSSLRICSVFCPCDTRTRGPRRRRRMLRLGLVVCLASRGMWRGCEGRWRLRDIRSISMHTL